MNPSLKNTANLKIFVENMSFNSMFFCRHQNIMDCLKSFHFMDCFKSSVIRIIFHIFNDKKANWGQMIKTQDKRWKNWLSYTWCIDMFYVKICKYSNCHTINIHSDILLVIKSSFEILRLLKAARTNLFSSMNRLVAC